jgi:hypothetical protein
MYIAKYGKTWYQEKFNAKALRKANVDDAIEKINKVMTSTKKKDFKNFHKKYLRTTRIEETHLIECQRIYDNSASLREFVIVKPN